MKKIFFLLFILYASAELPARILQTDTVVVNGTKFIFEKSSRKNGEENIDTILKVYRIEKDTRKYLLEHTLFTQTGDCNSTFKDYGAWEIKNDSIIFTTEFEVERDKNFGLPYREKQIYS